MMIKKQTNSLFKGLKDIKEILSFKNDLNANDSKAMYVVGECPKCGDSIIETGGVYSCRGRLLDTCDYTKPAILDGEHIPFEDIVKFGRYQKMMESGFLNNNTNLSNTSKNNNTQEITNLEEIEKTETNDKKVEIEEKIEGTHKTLGICPKCGGEVVYNNSKYSCTKCDYKLNGSYFKTKITPSVVEKLLKGEYSDWMQFTKKNGGTYKSRLMLDDKNYNYALVPYKKSASYNKNTDKLSEVKEEKKVNKESESSISLSEENSTNNKKSLGKCPICNKDIIAGKSAFGCMGLTQKTCTFKIPFKFDNMPIESEDMIKLLNGETILKKEANGEEVFLNIDREGILERVPF